MPGPDVPRLFYAIALPTPVAAEIGATMAAARGSLGVAGQRVRWVQVEGLHVTLRFLGPTAAELVPAAADALEAVRGLPGFRIDFAGGGAFPDLARPRALWVGIERGAPELGDLATAIDRALGERGWNLESRPYRPHLTIARTDGVRDGPAAAAALRAAGANLRTGFVADRVTLFRSHLGAGPARYEPLRDVTLG